LEKTDKNLEKRTGWLISFSYIVAIASLVMTTLTLYKIMINGSVQVSAPYGEAPFEIFASILSAAVMIFLLFRHMGITKETERLMNKIFVLSLMFFFAGCVFMNGAHFTTNYTLSTYPNHVIETNPIIDNMFKNYDFVGTFVTVNIGYLAITSTIYMVILQLSRKTRYPYNLIIANSLFITSLFFFLGFMMNFISDYSILQIVSSI
jgi:hypothetical protein